MALASTCVLLVGQTPQMSVTSICVHKGRSQWPHISLGGPRRTVCGPIPGFFELTASALGPRACVSVCVPFESRVFVNYSPPGSPGCKPCWSAKPGALQPALPLLDLGSWMWAFDSTAWGKLCSDKHPPVHGFPTRSYEFWRLSPSCLSLCDSFFTYFCCGKSFALFFRSFSLIAAL